MDPHNSSTPEELIQRAERLLKAGPKATYYAVQSQAVINLFIDLVEELSQNPTPADFIQMLRQEFNHALEIVNSSTSQVSRLQATGHAQCAVNLLARFDKSEEQKKRHEQMAELMEKVLNHTI